jgi:hypothetical protein
MRPELALLFTKFHSFILQTYSFVQQHLKVGEYMALQLIVERSNQSIQESFLPLEISVDFIRSIPGQMSELVEILSNRHVSLFQCKKLLCFSFITPEGI